MLDAIEDWRRRTSAPGYEEHVARARRAFGRLVGVPAGWEATAPALELLGDLGVEASVRLASVP